MHVIEWESLWQAGDGAELERWERDLAKTTDFWDFAGFNQTTMAPIAPSMPYLDPAHYLPEVGARMLACIYGAKTQSFCEHVDVRNVDAHLARIESARAAWRAQNEELVRRLDVPPLWTTPARP